MAKASSKAKGWIGWDALKGSAECKVQRPEGKELEWERGRVGEGEKKRLSDLAKGQDLKRNPVSVVLSVQLTKTRRLI